MVLSSAAQGSAGVTSQHGTVKKKKKRKAPPSASNVVGSTQEKVGRSHIHKYTGKRRRIIPIKTSALMGPTPVITRRRFQIRHLGS